MTKVVLISRSSEYEARLKALPFASLTTLVSSEEAFDVPSILGRVEDVQPDLVLLGPFHEHDSTNELSAELLERFPRLSLVLVNEESSLPPWLDELGAHAVVSSGANDETLVTVIERLAGQPAVTIASHLPSPTVEADSPPAGLEPPIVDPGFETPVDAGEIREVGRVISVISPKGGQGKTTIAANLAIGLARAAPGGVVLVDADMQFGDIEAVFGLTPAHTLPEMVTGSATRDLLMLKALLTPHSSGIFVVCGAASPADGDRVTGEEFGQLINRLASIFAYVVIDTTPGLGEHALSAIELSTDAIMVASPSVPTLLAVRKELSVLTAIDLSPSSIHFVLNLADPAAGLNQRDIEELAGMAVSVVIPRSSVVALATNRGIPVLLEGSRDSAAKALAHIVANVSGTRYAVRHRPARKKGRQ